MTKTKIPTWATVIGILMILFGGCGVMSDYQATKMPEMLEAQKEMMRSMSEDFKTQDNDSIARDLSDTTSAVSYEKFPGKSFENISDSMAGMLHMSEFTKKWTVRFGYIGIFVSFFYALAGIFLLIPKEYSLKLVYIALGISIIFTVTRLLVLEGDDESGLMLSFLSYSHIFGILVDVLFIIIIITSDKSRYKLQI
jgi:hypothetical protein